MKQGSVAGHLDSDGLEWLDGYRLVDEREGVLGGWKVVWGLMEGLGGVEKFSNVYFCPSVFGQWSILGEMPCCCVVMIG